MGFAPTEDAITDVLVLSRKTGERILIGDKIAITVVKVAHGGVRIGIEAPRELAVVREELAGDLRLVQPPLTEQVATDSIPNVTQSVEATVAKSVPGRRHPK